MGNQCGAQTPHVFEASRHLDLNHGEGTAAALKRLALVLKEVNETFFKAPLAHPVLVDLGVIMKHCKLEERYKQPFTSGKPFKDMPVLMRAARYARYAEAAYQAGQESILKTIQGDEEDFGGSVEILHVFKAARSDVCPDFFIAVDGATKDKDIVLSIRGEAQMADAITEAVGLTTTLLDSSVHERLLNRSRDLLEKAQAPLEEALKNNPSSSVYLVGHSLGGGAAVMATVQGFGEGSFLQALAAAGKLKCYAFAPPPTFEPGAKLPPKCASSIYSFVNNMDCIPRADLGSIGRLLVAVRKVDELDMDTPSRVKMLGDLGSSAEEIPDWGEIPEDLQPQLKNLHNIGTIILMYRSKSSTGSTTVCETVGPEQLTHIIVHDDMIPDHLMAAYEESITETLMQLQRSKGCC